MLQLPQLFLLMRDFNSHNVIWSSREINRRGKTVETDKPKTSCLLNQTTNTYLHPAMDSYSTIDLTICNTYLDYSWRVSKDLCGSDHFPIILENNGHPSENKSPQWNFRRANWEKFQNSCKFKLTPENDVNHEWNFFLQYTAQYHCRECITKSSTYLKCYEPWFDKNCKKQSKPKSSIKEISKNQSKENLNRYENSGGNTHQIIKESKCISWKNYITKININTKAKKGLGYGKKKFNGEKEQQSL